MRHSICIKVYRNYWLHWLSLKILHRPIISKYWCQSPTKREIGLNSRVLSNLMLVPPRLLQVHTVLLKNVLPTPNSAIFLACLLVLKKEKSLLLNSPMNVQRTLLSLLQYQISYARLYTEGVWQRQPNQTLRKHNFSWKTFETWKKNWSAIERVRRCVEVLYPVTRINPRNEDN